MKATLTAIERTVMVGLLLAICSNAEARSWQEVAPLPTARTRAGAGTIDGKIFVVAGGANSQWSGHLTTLEIYDPRQDKWTSAAPIPRPRWDPIVEALDGKLYVLGGFPDQHHAFVYDPETDSWSPIRSADPGGGHWGGKAVTGVIGGKIWIVNMNHGDVWAYDPKISGGAKRIDPGKPARGPTQGSVLGDKIFLVSGYMKQESSPMKLVPDVDVFDTSTGAWSVAAPLNTARFGAATVVVNGKLHVVGGYTKTAAGIETVRTTEVYSLEADRWTVLKVGLPDRFGMAFEELNGRLYAIGGWLGNEQTDRVDAIRLGRSGVRKPLRPIDSDALLTELSAGGALSNRLRIAEAIAEQIDPALELLLEDHLQVISNEAERTQNDKARERAKQLLQRLNKPGK